MIKILKKYCLTAIFAVACMFDLQCVAFDKKATSNALVKIAKNVIDLGLKDVCLSQFVLVPPADEDVMLELCKWLKKCRYFLSENSIKEVDVIHTSVKDHLKTFVATGWNICLDGNLGLVWDTMDPVVTVTFVNPTGEVKTRKHQLIINTIGPKFKLTCDFCLLKFTGSGFNYYDSRKELSLGGGIDVTAAPFIGPDFLYCRIKEMPGTGILMGGVALGIALGISGIYSGTITPIK